MSVQEVIPVLHVRSATQSVAWYERLGFQLDGEHTFGPGMPVYAFMSAGKQSLHLSEHKGDARPDTLLYVYVSDLGALAEAFGAPIVEQPWGREVHLEDPDGNRLRIGEQRA